MRSAMGLAPTQQLNVPVVLILLPIYKDKSHRVNIKFVSDTPRLSRRAELAPEGAI